MKKNILIILCFSLFSFLFMSSSFAAITPEQQTQITRLQTEAKALFDAKDYSGALTKFQTRVNQYPTSSAVPESLYYIGNCHYRLKNTATAVTTFNILIQQYSSDTWSKNAYRLLGYSYSSLHQDTEAIATFQKFINDNPNSSDCPDAALRIARLTSRSNPANTFVRLNAYKSVVDNYPNTPEAKEAQISYGRVLWRISEEISKWNLKEKLEKKDEIMDYFINLSQQYSGDTEIQAYVQMQIGALWLEKARLLDKPEEAQQRSEYFLKAKNELELLLSQFPNAKPEIIATVKLMLAEITVFTRDNNSALPEFKNIIAVFENDSTCRKQVSMAQYLSAWILETQKKYADAILEYQKILDNYDIKDNFLWSNIQALSLYSQFRCYSELGDTLSGSKVLLKLIEQYPNEEVAQRAKADLNKMVIPVTQ
jgi:TolA-binding protein